MSKRVIKSIMAVVSASLMVSVALANGYGVKGEMPSNAAAINKLLTSANSRVDSMIAPSQVTQAKKTAEPVTESSNQVKKNSVLGSTGLSQQAFAQTAHNLMPLSPQQIKTLRQLFNDSQRAAAQYPGVPPKPTSSSVLVNLSPGATPPVVRLRAGYVTSLVFLDSTGQPWPVVAYDLGNPKAFNLEPNQPNGKSDTILVEALDTYKSGNLAVMLKGLNTPIMITLMPGQRAVDYRVDMRVPGLGPEAKPMMDGLPNTGNPQLLTFLDGIPPNGAQAVQVVGGQAQAWVYDKHLFLRSRMSVISPAWLSTMSSPDGTHVFEMNLTPVVLASLRGSMVQLTMKGL